MSNDPCHEAAEHGAILMVIGGRRGEKAKAKW